MEEVEPHVQASHSGSRREPFLNPAPRLYTPPQPVDPSPVPQIPRLPAGDEEVIAAVLRRDREDVETGLVIFPRVHGIPEARPAHPPSLIRLSPHPLRLPGSHQPVQAQPLDGPDDV